MSSKKRRTGSSATLRTAGKIAGALVLAAAFAAPAGAVTFYKWTDDRGQVHYGDAPPKAFAATAKRIDVDTTSQPAPPPRPPVAQPALPAAVPEPPAAAPDLLTQRRLTRARLQKNLDDARARLDLARKALAEAVSPQDGEMQVVQGQPLPLPPGSTVPGQVPGSTITYDEFGEVAFIVQPYINANSTQTSGFDVDLRHGFPVGKAGTVDLSLAWTHVGSFRRTVNGSTVEYAGTQGPYVLGSAGGTPKNRFTFDTTWQYHSLTTHLRLNYVGSMLARDHVEDYDPNVLGDGVIPPSVNPPFACAIYGPSGVPFPPGCRVPAFTWFDLSLARKMDEHLTLNLSVENLFNRIAPFDPYTYGGFNANATLHQSGIVGRFFRLGARYRF